MTKDRKKPDGVHTTIQSQEELMKYKHLLESIHDAFGVVNKDNILTFANEKFAYLLGYSAQEMIGRKLGNFLDEENREIQKRVMANRSRGQSSKYELVWTTKSGEKVYTIVSGVPIAGQDNNFQGAFAVITDISDRIEAERKYRLLAESSIQGLCIIQDDRYQYVNPAFASIVGYSVDEIIQMSPEEGWSLVHPEDRRYLLRLAEDRRAKRRIPIPYEYRFVRKDGSIRWVQAFSSEIEYRGKRAVQILNIDITDAKMTQMKLRASQEMLETVMNTIPQFVYWKDRDSVYLGCNENFAKVAGLDTPDDIVGLTDANLAWRSEEATRLREIDKEAIEKNAPQKSIVMTQLQAQGKDAWIELTVVPLHDDDGEVIGLLGTYEDITEKRESQDQLKRSESKYRSLAEQSVQSITILDASSLLYYNPAFRDLIGYSDEELDHMSADDVWNLVHPEDRIDLRKRMEERLAERSVPPQYEYRLVRKDGELRWVESYSTKIDYEGSSAVQTLTVDITDRVQSEHELSSAKDRALLYLDIMGHDLAQQLQVILNSAALLKNATDESQKESFLRVIGDAVRRCSRMIEEAKSTEQLQSVPLRRRSLGAAVGLCVEALSDRTDNVNFEMKIKVVDSAVWADEYLEFLLTQVIVNAIEHNPGDDKRVWVELSETDTGYTVSIADNGKGIPDSVKKGLLDMSRRFGGLGLHTANQIAEKYRGRIEIQDRVKGDHTQGTEFRIWLPKYSEVKDVD